ncbi:MAG: hypothetical protein LBR41_02575, partial [Rickettsiales bacterium]|nr:hypothetical protein [Rickettsiales bacterium]
MFRNFLIFAIFATCCGYAFASDGNIPVWPMVGSEVDIQAFDCEEGGGSDNVRIVSKIGDDLIIDNHINPNTSPFASFSGGADMLHGRIVPAGFGVLDGAEMPLLRAEMLEDDGATVLAMSGPVRANTTVLNNVNWADYSAAAADVNSETILDVEE